MMRILFIFFCLSLLSSGCGTEVGNPDQEEKPVDNQRTPDKPDSAPAPTPVPNVPPDGVSGGPSNTPPSVVLKTAATCAYTEKLSTGAEAQLIVTGNSLSGVVLTVVTASGQSSDNGVLNPTIAEDVTISARLGEQSCQIALTLTSGFIVGKYTLAIDVTSLTK